MKRQKSRRGKSTIDFIPAAFSSSEHLPLSKSSGIKRLDISPGY